MHSLVAALRSGSAELLRLNASAPLAERSPSPRFRETRHLNSELPHFSVAGILLAAGASSRMGAPKLLLAWQGTSILGHLLDQWRQLGAAHLGIVHAASPADAQVSAELDRLLFPAGDRILNPHPQQGMFSSIQCAANWPGWQPGLTHWIITLGDQPHLCPETLQALLDFGAAHAGKICQPLRQGRRRHPVLLPQNIFLALKNSTARDLKDFLQSMSGDFAGWESDDAGLDFDLDTPADYERALRFAFKST